MSFTVEILKVKKATYRAYLAGQKRTPLLDCQDNPIEGPIGHVKARVLDRFESYTHVWTWTEKETGVIVEEPKPE